MKQGFGKRIGRLALNLAVAAAAVAAVWAGLTFFSPALERTEEAEQTANLATPVGLMAIEMQDEILVTRQFLGRLEATRAANIGFEFGGTIDTIPVQEGDLVRAGDVLAKLTSGALRVERTSLEASLAAVTSRLELAESEVDRIGRLVQRGAAAASSLEQIVSNRDTLASNVVGVESSIAQVDLRLENTELRAPFDGIVGAIGANLGETVAAGQSVVSIYESGGANFRVGLPTSLDPRDLLNPRITVNGQDYIVTLDAVRPDIDFRTNTRIAIFRVETEKLDSFGLSATLTGDVAVAERGAWVPVDAMRPSAEGYWILLAVGDDMVAERVAVEVQHLRGEEAFVVGAFENGTRIIRTGAQKVVPGQIVRAD